MRFNAAASKALGITDKREAPRQYVEFLKIKGHWNVVIGSEKEGYLIATGYRSGSQVNATRIGRHILMQTKPGLTKWEYWLQEREDFLYDGDVLLEKTPEAVGQKVYKMIPVPKMFTDV